VSTIGFRVSWAISEVSRVEGFTNISFGPCRSGCVPHEHPSRTLRRRALRRSANGSHAVSMKTPGHTLNSVTEPMGFRNCPLIQDAVPAGIWAFFHGSMAVSKKYFCKGQCGSGLARKYGPFDGGEV
jgi:hypothetical protein